MCLEEPDSVFRQFPRACRFWSKNLSHLLSNGNAAQPKAQQRSDPVWALPVWGESLVLTWLIPLAGVILLGQLDHWEKEQEEE